MKTRHQAAVLAVVMSVLGSGAAWGQSPPVSVEAVKVLTEAARREAKVKILQSINYTALNVDFDRTPAREAFGYLQAALGITIVGRYSGDAIGFGIDPETPITLNLIEMPATDVLQLMLEQCATLTEPCTWQIRGSYIEVGTKSRLGLPSAQITRVYAISDLVRTAPNFEDALSLRLEDAYQGYWIDSYGSSGGGGYGRGGGTINATTAGYAGGGARDYPENSSVERDGRGVQLAALIRSIIEPTAWAANGGTWATIQYSDEALIVAAPDFVHRQLVGYPKVSPPKHDIEEESKSDE